MSSNFSRPSDIPLPDGWDWDRVEAERIKWGHGDTMVPVACGPGVVAWGTINSVRLERGLLVNVYTSLTPDLLPTGAPDDDCARISLRECFPDMHDEEYHIARATIERDGRYWGGGGASPIFLITRAKP